MYRVSIILISLLFSCGDEKSISLKDAANSFANGDYETALESYLALIETQNTPARVGAGWCYLRLGDYASAMTQFIGVAADSSVDGYAGWSLALWTESPTAANAQLMLDKIDFVLRKNPKFTLSLDSRVTHQHLRYVKSISHLLLQEYQACIDAIRTIDGQSSFTADVNDPNIEDILLTKLQSLSSAQVIGKILG